MSDAEQAAAGVAAIVESAVENATAQAASAVAHAEQRAEAALDAAQASAEASGRIAEQLASAALEGERGRIIENLQREFYECRAESKAASQEVQSFRSQLEAIQAQVETLLALAKPPQSTPPISAVVEEPLSPIAEVLPGAESAGDESPVPETPLPLRTGPRRLRL